MAASHTPGILETGAFAHCDVHVSNTNFQLDDVRCTDPAAVSLSDGCTFQTTHNCGMTEGIWLNCISNSCEVPAAMQHSHSGGGDVIVDPGFGRMCTGMDQASCSRMAECRWDATAVSVSPPLGTCIDNFIIDPMPFPGGGDWVPPPPPPVPIIRDIRLADPVRLLMKGGRGWCVCVCVCVFKSNRAHAEPPRVSHCGSWG